MYILSYYHIIVNIRTLLTFIMYKASYFFDFLINALCFIQIKGDLPPARGGPLNLPINKIVICKINKNSYNKLRIYKDITQVKLVVNFRNIT